MSERDPEASVERLARAARAGSRAAFGRLVERLQEPLFNYLRMRLGNAADAEEACQEAFLRAWQRLDGYDPGRRFSTWLFTVARNVAASRRRAEDVRPRATLALVDVADATEQGRTARDGDPGRDLSRTEQRARLWELAARVLTEEQREALWLRYAEDLPPLEIARVLGRRPSTVRVLLFRARARLAEHLDAADAPAPDLPPVHVQISAEPR